MGIKNFKNQSGLSRLFIVFAILVVTVLATTSNAAEPGTLDIYFIDVEGGQATLVVIPGGETLLIDAGFPGDGGYALHDDGASHARDARRILAAAMDAGRSKIDSLLITHFHSDHFGGAVELSRLISIGTFIDHGIPAPEALTRAASGELFDEYKKVRSKGHHIIPAVGDRLSLTGVEATVVSTAGSVLTSPLAGAGATNPACDRELLAASEKYENPRSTGVLIQYGAFRFLDIGDLAGQPLSDLVCPTNLIGPVDAYLVPHHGATDSADPATLSALRPRVAILNNGPTKGGEAPIFNALRSAVGLEDTWQLHRSEAPAADNFGDEKIANLNEHTAFWIKLSAKRDGSFRIFNARTSEWQDYGFEH